MKTDYFDDLCAINSNSTLLILILTRASACGGSMQRGSRACARCAISDYAGPLPVNMFTISIVRATFRHSSTRFFVKSMYTTLIS